MVQISLPPCRATAPALYFSPSTQIPWLNTLQSREIEFPHTQTLCIYFCARDFMIWHPASVRKLCLVSLLWIWGEYIFVELCCCVTRMVCDLGGGGVVVDAVARAFSHHHVHCGDPGLILAQSTMGFAVDKLTLGQVFLQLLWLTPVNVISPMLHIHLFICSYIIDTI
jgi:hypothetical protein